MLQGIKLLILFGSRARGTAGAQSDADVAALADHELSLEELNSISEEASLELHVSEDDVDVVDLQNASPLLQYQVATQGKLLTGTRADFIRFQVLAWKRYLDTARLRRLRERAVLGSDAPLLKG